MGNGNEWVDRKKSSGCPDRWRGKHGSFFQVPSRPAVCPCRWSDQLIMDHWAKMMRGLDNETLSRLGDLGTLFVE
jgi:hypothetical protein